MRFLGILVVLFNAIIGSSSTTLMNFCQRTAIPGQVLNFFRNDSELHLRVGKSMPFTSNGEIIDQPRIVYGCGNELSEISAICKVKISKIQKIRIEWTTPAETESRKEETVKFIHPDEYESSLKIRNAAYTDRGNYKCNVIFEQGEVKSVERMIKVKPILGVEPVHQEENKIKLRVVINTTNPQIFHEWFRVDPQFDYITSLNGYSNYNVDFEKNNITLTINNFSNNEDNNDYYIFREFNTLAFIEFNITKTTDGYNVYYSAQNECEWHSEKLNPDFKFYTFIPANSQKQTKTTEIKPSC